MLSKVLTGKIFTRSAETESYSVKQKRRHKMQKMKRMIQIVIMALFFGGIVAAVTFFANSKH